MTVRNSIQISGGAFRGSAIGIGTVQQFGNAEGFGIADLRSVLATVGDDIPRLGRSDEQRAELAYEVRKIEQELKGDNPDGTVVKSRWKSVLDVLGTALSAGEQIANVTDLILKVFGGG